MKIAEAVMQELTRWRMVSVEPTHVVMTWDTLDALAIEIGPEKLWIEYEPFHIWGIPIVIVPDLAGRTWAIGSSRPIDADRLRVAASMVAKPSD